MIISTFSSTIKSDKAGGATIRSTQFLPQWIVGLRISVVHPKFGMGLRIKQTRKEITNAQKHLVQEVLAWKRLKTVGRKIICAFSCCIM